MNDQQTFQSPFRLFLLRCHAAWTKFENVVLFPARWVSTHLGQTHVFEERASQLRLVK